MSFKTYKDEERKKSDSFAERFCKPDPATVMGAKRDRYMNIGDDGLPIIGAKLNGGDIMIGKTVDINNSDNLMTRHTHKDISHTMKASDNGVIDKVLVSTNLDGEKFVKVRTRSIRIPEMGDKLASTHGQKGTIGLLCPQEDMPFTRDGISPDIIVNVHAINIKHGVAVSW